ncbi:hypothetical protein [Geomonas azotofigens]|uniref:hypothetical protein n=1 Tax=Geomonas azotofigens TaxID=2843196 RepID=UPI001C110340|nr:hypothetical protein [Geomonas azotofigens]MBU5612948.1 hypothetical protein [Geomonas azotofigens]
MLRYALLVCWLLVTLGCGGGGGGGSAGTGGSGGTGGGTGGGGTGGTVDNGSGGTVTPPPPPPVQPTSAVVTLATQGSLPQGSAIAGLAVTVGLPPGVTVATDANGGVAAGVVTGSGQVTAATTVTLTTLIPSTSTTPGSLRVVLASSEPAGFTTGEFAKIHCGISEGSFPKATEFSTSDFRAVDLRGTTITGLSPTFSATVE